MKKNIVLIIGLCVSVAVNLVALGAVIRGFGIVKGPERPPVHPRFEQRLHLSPEQRETMRQLRARMGVEMDSIRVGLDGKRAEILKLLKANEIDTVHRNELFKEISHLQMLLELKMFEHAVAVRNILTPEQRGLLLKPMEERFREWSGPGGPFGPGPAGQGPGHENRPRAHFMRPNQSDVPGGNR